MGFLLQLCRVSSATSSRFNVTDLQQESGSMSFAARELSEPHVRSLMSGRTLTILELGCGPRKRHADAIGIDMLEYLGVDLVGDVHTALAAFPDASVDAVYSYHFVEHVPEVGKLLVDLARVLKPDGLLEFVAPHFANPYFYSDPTHRSFFGLYTFDYYASSTPHRRKVPTYQQVLRFRVQSTRLGFKSTVPFYGRHVLKRAFGAMFDSCNYMRELHEELFSGIFPAYEVKYRLRRVASEEQASY